MRVDKEGQVGTGGTGTLRSGRKTIGKGRFKKQGSYSLTVEEGFDTGCDGCWLVSELYESPTSTVTPITAQAS
jgi:hypothetical protein